MYGTLTIDSRGVCAQGYPSRWLCPRVLLLRDPASGDAAAVAGQPLCAPHKEGGQTFPSFLLWGDLQLCAELFEASLLVLCPRGQD